MKKSYIFVAFFVAICLLTASCGVESPATESTATTEQPLADENKLWLDISAEYSTEWRSKYATVPGSDRQLEYAGLEDPKIKIDGEYIPLAEAVETGLITPEEILMYARLDAAAGNCKEDYLSKRGLNRFYYRYKRYLVTAVHDVYETPDGKQHLISSVKICDPGGETGLSHAYYDENHKPLDLEDWGITFELVSCDANGVVLRFEQTGGQHIGELVLYMYMILSEADGVFIDPIVEHNPYEVPVPYMTIANNAVTEYRLDWEQEYGSLPSGTYRILLTLEDRYDPEQVHPLMVNYRDMQDYWIDNVVIP